MNKNNHQKILFRLKKDAEGYPPDDWESLWATPTEQNFYSIDNIPFFVRGISLGDIVSIKKKDNELFFEKVEQFSDHSVIRVIIFEESEVESLRQKLKELGCESEKSHIEGLITVDIPPQISFDDIVSYLKPGEDEEIWEYEEASIRHE
jgi:Domain of unknown function (DUF4265)